MGKLRKKRSLLTINDILELAENYSKDTVSRDNFPDKIEYMTETIMLMDDARAVLEWLIRKYKVYKSWT